VNLFIYPLRLHSIRNLRDTCSDCANSCGCADICGAVTLLGFDAIVSGDAATPNSQGNALQSVSDGVKILSRISSRAASIGLNPVPPELQEGLMSRLQEAEEEPEGLPYPLDDPTLLSLIRN
jgi:hypothetical protein